ncbi:MAG TPA: thiamine-phosphate kinase [Steroidobacteraceae bacterium]|nr:thiamine-phosphate kinase [Steroidobacteraceae bacterium]
MPLGEFELIARYFAQQPARADVRLGIGDDAAVLDTRIDRKLVIAVDTIVEGAHFPLETKAADIGYRALAVNLSDMAAMGAEPSWFTLSLSLPTSDERWVEQFAAGLFELAQTHDVALVGGDTVKGPRVITIQIAGWVEADRWLTRSGARPGDLVVVSGHPGEAAGGLAVLQQSLSSSPAAGRLQQRFLRPTPRVKLGRQLRQFATAAMDVSDGLLTDLDKLCAASQCGASIDVDALPISADLRATFDEDTCLDYALAGGDDYELLFTIPRESLPRLSSLDVTCTAIGEITASAGVVCRRAGVPVAIKRRGYDHFDKDRS